MACRLLSHRLTITVDFDAPELVAEFTPAQVLKFASFVFTPTVHGLHLRRRGEPVGSGFTYRSSWQLLGMLSDCAGLAQSNADDTGGLSTATGRYHHDRAALYRAVHRVITARRHLLFPAEEFS